MNDQDTVENKKGFFQNDRLLVCSMLAFYGICILGLIGGTFMWLGKRNETISANATSTAAMIATQQANATATAVARATEQDKYEFVEHFDETHGRWFVGDYEKQYGDVQITIKDGVYVWDVLDSKNYTQSTDFYYRSVVRDFDVYMDVKFIEGSSFGGTCGGFYFRMPATGWNDGAYTFVVCDDSHYTIEFYENNKWYPITFSDYEDSIRRSDWNRIEVHAREDHFTFNINNTQIFETTDDRLKAGSLGILVNIEKDNSAEIWFDNFGFQSR